MMKNSTVFFRIGLSLIFLANGLTAFLAPQEFKDLIEASFILHWIAIPIPVFLLIIGFNDLCLAVLILFNKHQTYVLFWAMVWLVGVMIVSQDMLGMVEHLGFLSVALALWLSAYTKNS